MDKTRKKELISEWKERKPEMGIISVKCVPTGESFLDICKDTSNGFNRHKFQLSAGLHANKHLQELWNSYGESGFEFSVASVLEYENISDVKTEDLKELLELCLSEIPMSQKIIK